MREAFAEVGAAIVFAADGDAVAAVRVAARDTAVVLIVIESTCPALDKAMLLAAVGPLAVELAPAVRLGALDVAEGADSANVAAAASFLVGAQSTTGQVLRIA